jgi:hypothetical protein
LTVRLDSALASARDVKDAIASSFDVLIVRTEHRTNEIVKILTIGCCFSARCSRASPG